MMNVLSSLGEKIAALLGERVNYGTRTDAPSRQLIHEYLGHFPFHTLLPYQGYDPAKGLFYNEGSLGFVLETSPLIGCTEAMQRELSGLFQHTLPEGSSLQFLLWADPRIGGLLQNWHHARAGAGDIFQTLAHRRVTFLNRHVFAEEQKLPIRNLRCIVAYSQPGFSLNPVEEQQLLQLKEHVSAALKTLGMPVLTWHADDLLNMLDGLINFTHQTEPADLK